MQRVSNGYTIIEVIIFLAISGVLVLMSLTFLSGRESHTRFSQSMRDMQSKMQDWLNDVTTGFPGGISGTAIGDVHCETTGSSVTIDNVGAPTNSGNCIFLGKAIQFTSPPSTSVYVYSVFGNRTDSSGELVADLKTSGPVPAAGLGSGSTGTANLTETYGINGGARVKSVSGDINGMSVNSYMAGFYLSLNTEKSIGQNGDTDLKAYQYNLLGSYPVNSPTVVDCIRMQSPGCRVIAPQLGPPVLSKWQICFDNGGSSGDTALMTVSSTNGLGASVNLEFKPC